MDYRIEELAGASGLRVDTIRFYQGKGLLPPPRRAGRVAWYGEAHLERLRRIRELLAEGLPLALIKRVLDAAPGGAPEGSLAAALAREKVGARTLTRAELAAEAGVPEPLVAAARAAGLLEPIRVGDEERFGEADLAMVRAGLAILGGGFPIDALLGVAVEHAAATRAVAERAIDLFDRHVRRAGDPEAVTEAFRALLPEATRLVALFFQRTLVSRALARLEGRGESEALRRALAATESARLDVAWR
jgi:DNA-binding transcriptional MerR regulator